MPPGSKKSSASSNSIGTMHNTATVRVETAATTPASEILTSTPTIASPSTRASASGAPSAKRRRVRGPTRGKRIRRIMCHGEELSIKCLGEAKTKNYIRGLGNGPKPSTYLSKSNAQSAHQDQLQKLQHELDLIREEQRREREEANTRREEEQRRHEEEQRRHEEEQRRLEDKYEEEKRRWEETQRRQDEERSILLKEMEVFKSFMTQMQNGGRGNMGAG